MVACATRWQLARRNSSATVRRDGMYLAMHGSESGDAARRTPLVGEPGADRDRTAPLFWRQPWLTTKPSPVGKTVRASTSTRTTSCGTGRRSSESQKVARLNHVLGCVSECAGLADVDAVARVVGERLRWIFDFEHCVLALCVGRDPSVRAGCGSARHRASGNGRLSAGGQATRAHWRGRIGFDCRLRLRTGERPQALARARFLRASGEAGDGRGVASSNRDYLPLRWRFTASALVPTALTAADTRRAPLRSRLRVR